MAHDSQLPSTLYIAPWNAECMGGDPYGNARAPRGRRTISLRLAYVHRPTPMFIANGDNAALPACLVCSNSDVDGIGDLDQASHEKARTFQVTATRVGTGRTQVMDSGRRRSNRMWRPEGYRVGRVPE
jgi:hypothetical protein